MCLDLEINANSVWEHGVSRDSMDWSTGRSDGWMGGPGGLDGSDECGDVVHG